MYPPNVVSLYVEYVEGRIDRDDFETKFQELLGRVPSQEDYSLLNALYNRRTMLIGRKYQ